VKKGELSEKQKKGPAITVALLAACAVAGTWEGLSLTPYRDVRGVQTVCRGETEVKMRRYSAEECDKMFEIRMKYFRDQVRKRNPRLVNYPLTWGAHASFAYNVGVGTYNKSSVARLFQQGAYSQSCRAIAKYKYAGGHIYRGLLLRRTGDATRLGEVELCLEGLKK
jgi:lysozyme